MDASVYFYFSFRFVLKLAAAIIIFQYRHWYRMKSFCLPFVDNCSIDFIIPCKLVFLFLSDQILSTDFTSFRTATNNCDAVISVEKKTQKYGCTDGYLVHGTKQNNENNSKPSVLCSFWTLARARGAWNLYDFFSLFSRSLPLSVCVPRISLVPSLWICRTSQPKWLIDFSRLKFWNRVFFKVS